MGLFGYPHLKATFAKFMERQRSSRAGKNLKVNEQYDDQLNVLMRSYEEVPLSWFISLFLVSFIIIITIIGTGYLYIPLWTYFIALATGAVVVIVCSAPKILPPSLTILQPLGWLYSLSNFQLVCFSPTASNVSNPCSPSVQPTNSYTASWLTQFPGTRIPSGHQYTAQ